MFGKANSSVYTILIKGNVRPLSVPPQPFHRLKSNNHNRNIEVHGNTRRNHPRQLISCFWEYKTFLEEKTE
jgi:hypothetical protein